MAEKIDELYYELRARQNKLEKDFKDAERTAKRSGGKTAKMFGGSFKAVFAGLGVGLVLKKAFDFAIIAKNVGRDGEEIRSKFDTVFEGIKAGANSVADTFSKNFKLADATTRELLGTTGDLLVGFGFTEQAALDMSVEVNKLAQDLASFTNFSGGSKGASDALTKAILGETESAKSLGIVIRQDTKEFKTQVEALMLSKGVTLQQAKAMVILEEAYKQSGKAVGDFKRTQNSLANQERILEETQKQLLEQIGKKLIPIFADATTWANEFFLSLTETDLENTIRQLEEYGIAAEKIAKLKASSDIINGLNKEKDLREDIVQLIQKMNDFAKAATVFRIADDLEGYETFKKLIEDIASGTVSLGKAQDILGSKTLSLTSKTQELADAQIAGDDTSGIEARIGVLKFEINRLKDIIGLEAQIEGEVKKVTEAQKILSSERITGRDITAAILKNMRDMRNVSGETTEEEEERSKFVSEILDAYKLTKARIEQINEALKIGGLTIEEINVLEKERESLQKSITGEIEKQVTGVVRLLEKYGELRDIAKEKDVFEPTEPIDMSGLKDSGEIFADYLETAEASANNIDQKVISILNAGASLSSILGVGAHTFVGILLDGLNKAISIANSIFGIISAFGGGGGGFFGFIFGGGGASAAAHSGGNFLGTSSGVKKMAGGGSFIVPPGFQHDTYPLMVESGERVSVTPANQVNGEASVLNEIRRGINNLNENLVSNLGGESTIVVPVSIDGREMFEVVQKHSNSAIRSGKNLEQI